MTETERQLEARAGHPGELLELIQQAIQHYGYTRFAQVEDDWVRLMWAIDAYRIAGIPPRNMGKAELGAEKRLAAIYRSKGNWFATVLSLLLQNRTTQVIRPRTKVEGFSQLHQIDLAWPTRRVDPLICVETKVTGAPAYGNTPQRGALSDFSNRRKELKFAATDLKLFRRQQQTTISHWGAWRESAPPRTYFLWGARLRGGIARHAERVERLVAEARALVDSYLDGAGIVAWQAAHSGDCYELVPLPRVAAVTTLDDVLYRIESQIRESLRSTSRPPDPIVPEQRAVSIGELLDDADV